MQCNEMQGNLPRSARQSDNLGLCSLFLKTIYRPLARLGEPAAGDVTVESYQFGTDIERREERCQSRVRSCVVRLRHESGRWKAGVQRKCLCGRAGRQILVPGCYCTATNEDLAHEWCRVVACTTCEGAPSHDEKCSRYRRLLFFPFIFLVCF